MEGIVQIIDTYLLLGQPFKIIPFIPQPSLEIIQIITCYLILVC